MGAREDGELDRATRKLLNKKAWAAKNAAIEAEWEAKYHSTGAIRSLGRFIDRTVKQAKLTEIPDPRLMSDEQLVAAIAAALAVDKYDWPAHCRPDQREPSEYEIWLLLCGRGYGKTRVAAETVREVCETPNSRVAVVAKDHRALRDVCFEGVSGLIACIPPHLIATYRKGLGDVELVLTNGSTIKGYTAGEPDAVRGQSFTIIWGDEFAAWPRHRAEDMLTQLRMCLRESDNPRCILSTTPKRVPHVVNMVKLAQDPAEKIVITRGSSRDNTALNEAWHLQMERTYGNTRMGRQELDGELVMDAEKALWTGEMIDVALWPGGELPTMRGVITGVDPSGSKDGDATGICTVGWDSDNTLYVLDNPTCNGSPAERYSAVCLSAHKYGATYIYYESAYGGDNCAFGIAQQWKNLLEEGRLPEDAKMPIIRPSKLKGDKAERAKPVVLLYEFQLDAVARRRIWHIQPTEANQMAKLEEEMTTWETDATKSPNAIDACVHACRQILIATGQEITVAVPVSPHSTRKPPPNRVGGGYKVF